MQRQPPELQRKLVIYGGGLKCRVYINCLYCAKKADNPERIVGIIDDDPALHGLHIYGFRVFGGSDRLEQIHARHPFGKLLVTAHTGNRERMSRLETFCRERGIELRYLRIDESAEDPGATA